MVHYKYNICTLRTIPARILFKRVNYSELKLEVKSLYLGHNANSEYRSCV